MAAGAGARLQLITDLWAPLADLDPTQRPHWVGELSRSGIECGAARTLTGLAGAALVCRDGATGHLHQHEGVGWLVYAGPGLANDRLIDELSAAVPDLPALAVGDWVAPRRLIDAVREGVGVGSTL